MYIYRKTNGRAHDLRLVAHDYQPTEGEITGEGHELPPIETLHDPVEPKVVHNTKIDKQIVELEARNPGYPRGVREFMLAMAQVVKAQGGPDFMQSPGMKNVEALENAAKALRAQRLP